MHPASLNSVSPLSQRATGAMWVVAWKVVEVGRSFLADETTLYRDTDRKLATIHRELQIAEAATRQGMDRPQVDTSP